MLINNIFSVVTEKDSDNIFLVEGLKRSSLVVGNFYRCVLGGFPVLITEVVRGDVSVSDGKNYDIVYGRYFNPVTGKYDQVNIIDGQLVDIYE